MYGRSSVSVKVERGLTFTFTRGLSYIASISFMHVKFTCVRDSANQPLLSRARRKTQSNTKRERRAQCARPTKEKLTSYRVFILVFLCHLIFSPLSTWLPRSMPAFVCLFVFFLARPRGTLIATPIIKETWKLRINLSLEVCFDSPQLSVSPKSKSFALQNTPADHEVFRPHKTSESNHWNRNFLKSVSSRGANLTKLLQV